MSSRARARSSPRPRPAGSGRVATALRASNPAPIITEGFRGVGAAGDGGDHDAAVVSYFVPSSSVTSIWSPLPPSSVAAGAPLSAGRGLPTLVVMVLGGRVGGRKGLVVGLVDPVAHLLGRLRVELVHRLQERLRPAPAAPGSWVCFGPAMLGTTSPRSSSRVAEKTGSGLEAWWNMPLLRGVGVHGHDGQHRVRPHALRHDRRVRQRGQLHLPRGLRSRVPASGRRATRGPASGSGSGVRRGPGPLRTAHRTKQVVKASEAKPRREDQNYSPPTAEAPATLSRRRSTGNAPPGGSLASDEQLAALREKGPAAPEPAIARQDGLLVAQHATGGPVRHVPCLPYALNTAGPLGCSRAPGTVDRAPGQSAQWSPCSPVVRLCCSRPEPADLPAIRRADTLHRTASIAADAGVVPDDCTRILPSTSSSPCSGSR